MYPISNKTVIFLIIFLITMGRSQNFTDNDVSLVNTAHLDHLYEEVMIAKKQMAIIHIYADYPDYTWVDVPEEGSACVDDVARAAVFYLYHYERSGDKISLRKAKKLLDFIQYMQAPNGLFHNFIYSDLSINTSRENSKPAANWWTWRAIWALAEALRFFVESDPAFAGQLKSSIDKAIPTIDSIVSNYPQQQRVAGLALPSWLPAGTAADQASVIQFALLAYQAVYPRADVQAMIEKIGTGLVQMQINDDSLLPNGVFLSWKNTWHDWGNCQAAALLNTVKNSGDSDYLSPALKEVDLFHPYLIKKGYLSQFEIRSVDKKYKLLNEKKFPQIAYGIRPLVWANLSAYDLTQKDKYSLQAAEITCWLFGKNDARKPLYDPKTGRCFDGIDNARKINKNSGAESTIEALLTLILVEKNARCKSLVWKYYDTFNKD